MKSILMTMLFGLLIQATWAADPIAVAQPLKNLLGEAGDPLSTPGAKAIVLVVQGNGCPIMQKSVPMLRDIEREYKAKGVQFTMINASSQDTPETVTQEITEYGLKHVPVFLDAKQQLVRSVGFTRISEVAILDPATRKVLYRGMMDDRFGYGRTKASGTPWLRQALDEVLAGKPVKTPRTEARGCLIRFGQEGSR